MSKTYKNLYMDEVHSYLHLGMKPIVTQPHPGVNILTKSCHSLQQHMKEVRSYLVHLGMKSIVTQPHLGVRQSTKSCCLSTPLQQLFSSCELKSNDGKERVLLVEFPHDQLLPGKSATVISLATMWVNILLRKAVKMKHLSWAYVLHILNGDAASITFDELFKMSIQSSWEDVATQVFSSVLQNESLQDELFDFLKALVQLCIVKGGAPLQDIKLTISSDIMETSGLKAEFESLRKGEYERVLKVHAIPDRLGGPPHLTAYLTLLVDAAHISEKVSGHSSSVNQSLKNCRDQHTPRATSREESTIMEELQVGVCHTPVTSSTSGTASKGSKDPCTHAVEYANEKPQTLKKDPDIEDRASNTQNHRDVPKFQPPTTAQPKPVENIYLKQIKPGSYGGSNCKLTDIQDGSLNSSITGTETENATSSCMYTGVTHNSEQPCPVRKEINDPCEEPATSHNKPTHSSSSLPPPSPHAGEQLVCPMKQETGSTAVCRQFSLLVPTECYKKLLWHVKQPVSQETVLTQVPEPKRELAPNISNDTMLYSPTSGLSQPHSWDTDVLKNCSSLVSLKSFVQPLPPEVLTLKDTAQGKTLCHTLVGLYDQGFTSSEVIHLLEKHFLQRCMACQDSSGNTPLHCSVDVQKSNTDIVKFLLRFTSHKSLLVLTHLELSFAETMTVTFSCICSGVTQNSEQPCSVRKETRHPCEEPATSINKPTHSYFSLPPPSPHAGELLVRPMKQETGACAQFSLPLSAEHNEKLLWHVKQPVTQRTILIQIPEAKRENGNISCISNETMLSSPSSGPPQPHSWDTDVLKICSSLASLKSFIQSLTPEVLTLKDTAQGKTLCHALVGLCDQGFTSNEVIHLLELLEDHFLQQCMACRDSSGNTPLHCSVYVQNASTSIVEILLRFTSHESLLILNNDNLTPLELSLEKGLWLITQLLIEHQIETGASCAELFQQYVLKAAKKEGGPNISGSLEAPSQTFSYSTHTTPPSKIANYQSSSDRDTSKLEQVQLQLWLSQCDGDSLTEGSGCHMPDSSMTISSYSGIEKCMGCHKFSSPAQRSFPVVAGDELFPDILLSETNTIDVYFESTTELSPSGEPSNIDLQPTQTGSLTPLLAELPEGMSQSSSESLSEGGMTSLEADDSSDIDGGAGKTLPKTKRPASRSHRKRKKATPALYGSSDVTKLLWHIQQPVTQGTVLTQLPEAKRENGSVSSFNGTMLSSPTSRPSLPHSWNTDVLKNCSSLAILKNFIQSLPPEMLTLKDAAQGKTLCHALVGLCDQGFTSNEVIHLLELLEDHFLQQCMACRGNTPLHCSVYVQNASTSIVEFLLRFTSRESLLILNNDNLTPLELSFEKHLWLITQMLIEHQIETGTSCTAELLQQCILKAIKEEGGANFLSQLLDLRDHHCPDLNLNFGSCESSRTPWWYLVNSTDDVNVMSRVLQALRDHSIEFKSLLTRTDGETNLVEEAMKKNKTLFDTIQRVAGWVQGEEDQSAPNKEGLNISGSADLVEEVMESNFSRITERKPSEKDHISHDKERMSISASEVLPQQTPSYSSPSKIADDQSTSDRHGIDTSKVQVWLSKCDAESPTDSRVCSMQSDSSSSNQDQFPWQRRSMTVSSASGSGMESGDQRLPKGKSIFRSRQPKTNAIFRGISSSESEVECIGCHKFSDPAQRSFQAVAGDEESKLPPDILTNTIQAREQYYKSTVELPLSGEPSNIGLQPTQSGSLTQLSTELPKDMSQSSSESFSEGGMTSLEADDSSDGGASGTFLPKNKRPVCQLHRKCKKTIPAVHSAPHVTSKGKKSSLVVRHQQSGYSGDDSDHKNECNKMKSFRFNSAQRAAGTMRKEQLYSSSSSESSEEEIDEHSAQIGNTEYLQDALYGGTYSIKLSIPFTVCELQLLNSTDHLSLMTSSTPDLRRSTELHLAVRQQCLKSVKRILKRDGGEDQVHARDEKGYTPLETASQSSDLKIFEILLASLVCSQASPSVILPPCSGRQQVTLMTSIVKVLSKLEIDICPPTLHWTIVGCQHWDLPMVVYATSTTVLTTIVLQAELLWSYYNRTLMDELFSGFRGGIKKKKSIKMSEELATQEQETPFQSELMSDTREFDILVFYRSVGFNSLVTGITLTRSKVFEFHQRQTRTSTGTPLHQPNHPLMASDAGKIPSSINPTPSLAATGSTVPVLVAADSPSYSQPKSSATKQSTSKQVSQPTDASLDKDSDEEVTAWKARIEKAVDCLHASYFSQMLELLKFGKVLPLLHPEITMAVQFGCALAYYKLDKHNEAAKHLESLKMIAASAQSCGNESIASVYLGDIEFTQSRYTEAAKHYSHALELYKSDNNVGKPYKLIIPTFSAISAKLGSAFRNASKVVDAVQAYRRAIATADSKKDKLSAHTSLGNLFQSVGENASALAEYEHSIRLSEELKDHVSRGWAYGNMGNAYLGLYQRDKGLNYLMKALDLTVKYEPTPQAISRAYNNLGTAYQALNELDKAEENYDQALSQSIYGNDLPGQARVYGNIGNVLMLRKDYERAVPHYTEVLHLSRDRSTVSTAFHNRGCSYYEWAESRKATLFQKDGSSVKKDQFFLSGPDFKDCEVEHQPTVVPNSILKYYQQGRQDLQEVVKYHEETFDNIKGSSKGLTLSVSLFETNSRTFHRLQDCLVNLGEWEKALVVAEQSRTRTLGELLVKRKGWQIDHPLTAPLNLDTISDVVKSQHSIVVYLSYTGARLLGWILAPRSSKVSTNMFEVPLEDDQFEGKSFDYHLRYSLTEVLVERNFEMYRTVDYQSELNEPVRKLYRLVGKPLMKIFKELKDPDSTPGVQEIVIIPDSYTNLLPFPCLLADEDDGGEFLGDSFSFRIMPSLLTMGIVDQLPSVVVQVPADSQNMCVVGNPTIPTFMYNDEKWNLGKLPFATREAEWVANTLMTTPILHEQATKNAILMRIMNAKVIHMATHGSASAGFLAFAGMSSRNGEAAESKSVLLYPEDVERLSISPALVVLSSCDSGRGTVKADGILGMARAFILAGAQAVLTTLWRVPDESSSTFMQFFYQYLMDGVKASLALQKATLSVRCFSKYSQFIHWSGYQLTGREVQFDITKPSTAAALEARLGRSSVFPRLEVVKQLESAFLKDPHSPSDVQILRGSPGVKPSEPLIDFIHSFHHAFKGGIFWINGRRQELIDASAAYIKQVTGSVPTASQTHPLLIIFDYIDQMPRFSDPSTSLTVLLRNSNTHIVVISKNYAPPDALQKEIDHELLRSCKVIDVEPLSMIHTTQRIVHSALNAHHLAPTNEDQNFFEKLAEFTSGSPVITDVATALLLSEVKHDSQAKPQDIRDTLMNFKNQLSLDEMGPSTKPVTVVRHEPPKGSALVREISKNVYDNLHSIKETEQDPWCTSSTYDSWQAVTMLVDQCSLTAEEKLLLFAVSMFSCSPIPMSMVTEISSMITKASQKLHISTSLHSKLFQMHLMKRHPLPVILHPSLNTQKQSTEPEFVYMPQYIARAIGKDIMSPRDKVMALSTSFIALRTLADNTSSSDMGFLGGLCSLLMEVCELNYELIGKECYQEVYKLYLRFHIGEKQQSIGAHSGIQFPEPP